MAVLMWEAVAASGPAAEDLLDWVFQAALPALAATQGYVGARVFRSDDQRLVVIAWWRQRAGQLPDPPAELVRRPPSAWQFQEVRR